MQDDLNFATVEQWHAAMIEADQRPVVMEWTHFDIFGGGPDRKSHQLEVEGRSYDDARDKIRWSWMRAHRDEVADFLVQHRESRDGATGTPFLASAAGYFMPVWQHQQRLDGGIR